MKKLLLALPLLLPYLAGPAFAGTVAPTTQTVTLAWDSNTAVVAGVTPLGAMPWAKGTVVSCTYYTAGSSASFTAQVKIGSTAVTGCNAMAVSSSTPTTVAATANNTFTAGATLSVVTSNVVNLPNTAVIQINIQATAN
jgi:hypothetical protein